MDLLDKKITSDWIDIREKLTTPVRLKTYLKLEELRLASLPQELRQSSMDGVVELKRRMVNNIFGFLSKLSHTTPGQTEIMGCENDIRILIYLFCIETLFAVGQLKPARDTGANNGEDSTRTRVPVDQIVQEVTARVAQNQELAKDSHVKNILMEIQMYKKEYAQFAALSPKIPDDRAPSFFANFKLRLDGIINNIHSHYQEILDEEDAEARKEFWKNEQESLISAPLAKVINSQAQELSLMRSTILFALQEGYQIRNLLLRLTNKKDPFAALVDEELRILDSRQEPGTHGHPISVKMARNMALVLEGSFNKKS